MAVTRLSLSGVPGRNYSFTAKAATVTPANLALSVEHLNKITLTIEKVSS